MSSALPTGVDFGSVPFTVKIQQPLSTADIFFFYPQIAQSVGRFSNLVCVLLLLDLQKCFRVWLSMQEFIFVRFSDCHLSTENTKVNQLFNVGIKIILFTVVDASNDIAFRLKSVCSEGLILALLCFLSLS